MWACLGILGICSPCTNFLEGCLVFWDQQVSQLHASRPLGVQPLCTQEFILTKWYWSATSTALHPWRSRPFGYANSCWGCRTHKGDPWCSCSAASCTAQTDECTPCWDSWGNLRYRTSNFPRIMCKTYCRWESWHFWNDSDVLPRDFFCLTQKMSQNGNNSICSLTRMSQGWRASSVRRLL